MYCNYSSFYGSEFQDMKYQMMAKALAKVVIRAVNDHAY
jgi:hypothetical protein